MHEKKLIFSHKPVAPKRGPFIIIKVKSYGIVDVFKLIQVVP